MKIKLNCGQTADERWEADKQRRIAQRNKLEDWHSYFAIIPRRVTPYELRWMETIERKGTSMTTLDIYARTKTCWNWEYRPKQ